MKYPKPYQTLSGQGGAGIKRLFLLLSFSTFFFACRKTSMETRSPVTPSTFSALNGGVNLISNGSFLNTSGGAFNYWTAVSTNGGVISQVPEGLHLAANAAGKYYMYQKVQVEAHKFYKISVNATYTLKDYSACGIYVMDSTLQTVLGKFEMAYSNATDNSWQFVFNSQSLSQVTVVIGFLDGINGSVTVNNTAMQAYTYQPNLFNSDFASHLNQKFPLNFTADQFDTTVSFLGDYINNVLLCQTVYVQDSAENTLLDQLIGSDSNYTYFNTYRHQPAQVKDGYCQRSSLSLGEILTNEFNIPIRQMYMDFSGVGEHQFLEYWNPFSGKWIIIDPCFNVRYIKNNSLLGDVDFSRSDAPGLMVRFGTHTYYPDTSELVELWQGYDVLQVSGYYSLTFPY